MNLQGSRLEVRELSVVVSAVNHNPTILNPDFLQFNEIVPKGWKPSDHPDELPICVPPFARVVYPAGVTITSEYEKVVFFERFESRSVTSAFVPDIAKNYVQQLQHVEYTALGINPRGDVTLPGGEETPRKYLLETLVAAGPWTQLGDEQVRVSLRFRFMFQGAPCVVTVDEAQRRDDKSTSVLVFGASFHHSLDGVPRETRISRLQEMIDAWEGDVQAFTDIVHGKFLPQEAT